jgi:aminomethyltransferase
MVTNDVGKLADGAAMYTCTCRPVGGIVDELIVYRKAQDDFFIVINASTTEKDFAHFVEHAGSIAEWRNVSSRYGLLSVQGPQAMRLIGSLTNGKVPPRAFTFVDDLFIEGMPGRYFVSRTGYTGEDGVEILAPAEETAALWDLLLERGGPFGIKPIGLGARDTLRLEARLCLYGNDIDEDHNPIEAGLGWVVKGKGYVGEGPVEKTRAEGPRRKLVGFKVEGRGIARHGYAIHKMNGDSPGEAIGVVTSGTVAPTVGGAIGLGWVPSEHAQPGARLAVDCRGKFSMVELVKGPFYTRPR